MTKSAASISEMILVSMLSLCSYAIDALCIDSKRAESLSQSPENGIGVFVTKRHRDEAAQLCGHGQLAAGGLRFFSTSASVIIIIIGSTGHSWNPART